MAGRYEHRVGPFVKWNRDSLIEQVRSVSVIDERDCWSWRYRVWQSHDCSAHKGYPSLTLEGKTLSVARWLLELRTGEVGEVARHTCDQMCCVNPEHLLWGTSADNIRDQLSRGRHATQRETLYTPNHSGDNHWTRRSPEKVPRGDQHWMIRDPNRAMQLLGGDRNGSRKHPERLARGEHHGKSKVTADDVRVIRQLISDGVPRKQIAERFYISVACVKQIGARKTWQHV